MTKKLPRYPIYIPTKGRAEMCLTARFLVRDGVEFRLVVEEKEAELYAEKYGAERLLILPFSDRGTVVPARNWIWDHAIAEGHERHWQFDDNIRNIRRWYRGKRIIVDAGVALAASEDFIDRYENVAVGGLNYTMFAVNSFQKAFTLNVHVYSCSLLKNDITNRFRGKYNEDTDLCLQVLADGWCTVLLNAFLAEKMPSMVLKGGNTDELEYFDDGRLRMAKALEQQWPGVVETKRRFRRPQHVIKDAWKKFDTALIRKPGVTTDATKPDEYGMELKPQGKTIKSPEIKKLVRAQRRAKGANRVR